MRDVEGRTSAPAVGKIHLRIEQRVRDEAGDAAAVLLLRHDVDAVRRARDDLRTRAERAILRVPLPERLGAHERHCAVALESKAQVLRRTREARGRGRIGNGGRGAPATLMKSPVPRRAVHWPRCVVARDADRA